MARRRLGDPGGTDGILHRPLEHGFAEVAAEVGLVLLASAFQVGGQGDLDRGRQHRHQVLVALETVLIPATPSCSWASKIVDRRGAYKRNPATIEHLRFAARSSPTTA
jgi:hypothetical protein